MTNGSRVLRSARSVNHEITSIGIDEHLVSIEAGKDLVRMTGKGLFAAAFSLATLTGIAVAAGPGNAATGAMAGLWTALAFGAGAAFIVRSWSSRINRAISRALDAITDPKSAGVFDRFPGRSAPSSRAWASDVSVNSVQTAAWATDHHRNRQPNDATVS